MNSDEFAKRFGMWPRKAHDPLHLGKWRRRKIVAISSVVVAGVACNMVTAKLSNYPGHSMLQKFVVDKRHPVDFKKHLFVLSTVVFLTSGTTGTTQTTFPGISSGDPGNIVECIGGGGSGVAGTGCSCAPVPGAGGSGGGYGKTTGFAIGATFNYAIGGPGGTTSFLAVCSATGGGITGGTGSGGALNHTGGTRGTAIAWGGGGGGAAGLNGNGNNGTSGTSLVAGSGGSGDAGFGGTGATGILGAGATGGTGNEYGTSHGSGGGGSGSGNAGVGGNGGLYGGGAGGGGTPGAAAGTGAQGLIVVTYTPLNFISDLSNMVNPRVRTFVVGY